MGPCTSMSEEFELTDLGNALREDPEQGVKPAGKSTKKKQKTSGVESDSYSSSGASSLELSDADADADENSNFRNTQFTRKDSFEDLNVFPSQRPARPVWRHALALACLVVVAAFGGFMYLKTSGPAHNDYGGGAAYADTLTRNKFGDLIFEESRKTFWRQLGLARTANAEEIARTLPNDDPIDNRNTNKQNTVRKNLCEGQLKEPKNQRLFDMGDMSKLGRGTKTTGLNFDPVKVKTHFQQYKDMLQEYYEDNQPFLEAVQPNRKNPGREKYMKRLVDLFITKIVQNQTLTVGAIGTSSMAGVDNCYYYSFVPMLQRMWKPMMDLVGVEWVVKGYYTISLAYTITDVSSYV